MKPITIFAEGQFGRAVAQIVAQQTEAEIWPLVESQGKFEERISRSEWVAVALWRSYVKVCGELDRICHHMRMPWSCVHLFENQLLCGPVVIPEQSACYECFRRRSLTHNPVPEREFHLMNIYGRNPELGPEGFVPAMAWIAAAALLEDMESEFPKMNRFRILDIFTGNLTDTQVIRVHNCPRCGHHQGRDLKNRFVDHIVPEVEAVL